MSKEIIINHSHHETRVALMEDGMLTELQYEREREQRIVGNIYKGRVVKVLPGMESAFIDIGAERAAFLHIDDIIPEEEMDGHGKRNSRKEKQPIDKLLKEGNPILVQVSKGPIGTKGARITGHVSMPGRNLVYIPGSKTLGVSRQIADERERDRLKNIVNRLKPEDAGFIIRTVAENRSEDDLHSDINYLISLWEDIREKYQTQEAPSLLHSDLNVIFRTLRDLFSSDIKKLVVDHKEEYKEIKNFVRSYLPRYGSVVEHYSRRDPIFDHYNIEMEIERALSPKVWLRSGGSLVINQTEALTAIDVNTGRFVGKESHEKTILRTNLEAAEEVVNQLQLRNIGGIIIIDFIDMEIKKNRDQVIKAFEEALARDKTRTQVSGISDLGLVEMTRRRTGEGLLESVSDTCEHCDGRGVELHQAVLKI